MCFHVVTVTLECCPRNLKVLFTFQLHVVLQPILKLFLLHRVFVQFFNHPFLKMLIINNKPHKCPSKVLEYILMSTLSILRSFLIPLLSFIQTSTIDIIQFNTTPPLHVFFVLRMRVFNLYVSLIFILKRLNCHPTIHFTFIFIVLRYHHEFLIVTHFQVRLAERIHLLVDQTNRKSLMLKLVVR